MQILALKYHTATDYYMLGDDVNSERVLGAAVREALTIMLTWDQVITWLDVFRGREFRAAMQLNGATRINARVYDARAGHAVGARNQPANALVNAEILDRVISHNDLRRAVPVEEDEQ